MAEGTEAADSIVATTEGCEGRARVATPIQCKAETPSPWAALFMTRHVLDQDGRHETISSSKTAQSAAVLGTGIATTKEKRPNGVGKLATEAKREQSQRSWAKRQRWGQVASAPSSGREAQNTGPTAESKPTTEVLPMVVAPEGK
jgi:hypothetical protein